MRGARCWETLVEVHSCEHSAVYVYLPHVFELHSATFWLGSTTQCVKVLIGLRKLDILPLAFIITESQEKYLYPTKLEYQSPSVLSNGQTTEMISS